MEITRFVKEESLGEEIVFVTVPPMTDELVQRYNERKQNHPDVSLSTRNGRLIVTNAQYTSWTQTVHPGAVAQLLAEQISVIESEITTERAAAERTKTMRLTNIQRFFGVPPITLDELRNNESASS